MKNIGYCIFLGIIFCFTPKISAQEYWGHVKSKPSTLGLDAGLETYKTPSFTLKLVNASQTVAALSPNGNPDFDFTPGEWLKIRDKDSLYQLGDITFRIRYEGKSWKSYSTAWHRSKVEPLEAGGNVLAAADLANTFASDLPLQIKRYYELDNDDLVLRFEIKNTAESPIEIGALGIPMVFDNILEGKSLDETHAENVFFDPYIGEDAGYLEVKRLTGEGPVLLVLPNENMSFEAYRPLLDDLGPRSVVFEGYHEWMSHSKAYAETDWKGAEQWNMSTSTILQPDESKNFSIKFVLAPELRQIQSTLTENNIPVAVGIPGYVLSQDVNAQLFLKHKSAVKSFSVEPKGALGIIDKGKNKKGYQEYSLQGKEWGRARLTINYEDSLMQTINYKIIKPETEVVRDFGHFLTTKQWFDKKNDPFHRNPSVISYDYEAQQQVVQDSRAWIAGLSDEGGAGSWLGAIMKQLIQPDREEVEKLEQFVDKTIWGGIQYDAGKNIYGVKKSMFYYEPDQFPTGTYSDTINYKTWAAWDKKGADDPGRSYNYAHVTAAYWVMYRLAKYHDKLVTKHAFQWYLEHAYHTAMAMSELAPYYAQFGQMEGTVFLLLLEDIKNEGLTEMATALEAGMKKRAEHWKSLNYPFGSEMPWDSTGQEEVFMWSDYFGYDEKAKITLNAILAYMPTMPHWAYNGNARRYWDFLYGGKLSRIERQIHHYGSGLNAIPILKQYRKTPEDFYLLKVGYGGLMGSISNITEDGFGPAAFHSFPSTMRIDYLSGDYGSGFFGYAVNTATYITKDPDFGWLAFGGNLEENNDMVKVDLTTAAKNRIYLAAEKLWITLDAGKFLNMVYNENSRAVEITLDAKDQFTPKAFLRINRNIKGLSFPKENGAYVIELDSKPKTIKFQF